MSRQAQERGEPAAGDHRIGVIGATAIAATVSNVAMHILRPRWVTGSPSHMSAATAGGFSGERA
jgi:hypothetical protein